jgi:hypothetical protein
LVEISLRPSHEIQSLRMKFLKLGAVAYILAVIRPDISRLFNTFMCVSLVARVGWGWDFRERREGSG